MLLPLVLAMEIVLFPDLPTILIGSFETEVECTAFAEKLDQSTPILLRLTCLVDS
jgi:hypothetical protein